MKEVAVCLMWLVGCHSADYACTQDAQCEQQGQAGQCQPSGFCSFPDPACESGQRFGAHGGAELASQCVPVPATSTDSFTSGGSTDSVTSTGTSIPTTTGTASSEPSSGGMDETAGEGPGTTGSAETTGPVPDAELVLAYRFEDPLADGPQDGTDSGLDGMCTACPVATAGVHNEAAQFGAPRVVIVPSSPVLDLVDGLSVVVWVRIDAWSGQTQTIASRPLGVGAANSWELCVSASPRGQPELHVALEDTGGRTHIARVPTAATTSTWLHTAFTWDGATLRLYVEGSLRDEVPAASIAYDGHQIRLGADLDNRIDANFLEGALDEFQIYRGALTPGQVERIAGG